MTFQAYLDAVEDKTGLTPRQLLAIAHEKGFDAPGVKAGAIVAALKEEFGLGHGHAMAIVALLKDAKQEGRKP